MKDLFTFINLSFLILFAGCCSNRITHESLNGVVWTQTSLEHKFMTIQAFDLAKENIEKALKDKNWTAALEQKAGYQKLKPAIIVDVDETVLDNSPFQARLVESNLSFTPELWAKWVNEISADAMPGAKSFVQYLKQKDIKVFYVTNRILKKPTLKNIRIELNPDVTSEELLCKNEILEWTSDKTSRRKVIAKNYRIILLVGDDYNDFAFLGKVSPEERNVKAETQQQYWGKKWILISNPLYGNWEKSIYKYDYKMPDYEKLKIKYKYLKKGVRPGTARPHRRNHEKTVLSNCTNV